MSDVANLSLSKKYIQKQHKNQPDLLHLGAIHNQLLAALAH